MNWELDRRILQMTPKRRTGVEVSAGQGGIMVEDFDRNIEFLINYGTSRITNTFGCTPDNIKLFNMSDARKIADKVKRLGSGRGINLEFMDFRTYLINSNFSMRTFSIKLYDKLKPNIKNEDLGFLIGKLLVPEMSDEEKFSYLSKDPRNVINYFRVRGFLYENDNLNLLCDIIEYDYDHRFNPYLVSNYHNSYHTINYSELIGYTIINDIYKDIK